MVESNGKNRRQNGKKVDWKLGIEPDHKVVDKFEDAAANDAAPCSGLV